MLYPDKYNQFTLPLARFSRLAISEARCDDASLPDYSRFAMRSGSDIKSVAMRILGNRVIGNRKRAAERKLMMLLIASLRVGRSSDILIFYNHI